MARVTLVPTGQQFVCEPGESVLAAALRAGFNLPHSCKGGHCASCRARLLAGSIEYPAGLPAGLTAEEAAQGFVLLCQARAREDLCVESRAIQAEAETEIRSLPVRIERMTKLAPDVMSVQLRLPAVERFPHRAGQYLDVILPEGRRRSFSIASAPEDGSGLELHIRRAPGGGFTGQLFDSLRPGALLRIEGPLGQLWMRSEAGRPIVMVAGGTGYAPLRAILHERLAAGDTRSIVLYWGARSVCDLYEHARLVELAGRHESFEYRPVLSAAAAESWSGRRGLVHEALLADFQSFAGVDVYAAGPPAMIEALRATLPAQGLLPHALHFDSFDYAPDTLAALRTASSGG